MGQWRIIIGVLLALLAAGSATAELTPARLRCEYRDNPMGIDATRPRLSWVVESRRRDERQTAYQVLVAGSEARLRAGRGDRWNSRKVASGETVHIPYDGQPLASGQECWWKVRCWDRDGRPSAYSPPARWTMGLLRPSDWKARWISRETPPVPPGESVDPKFLPPSPFLRRAFRLDRPVRRAYLYATALGLYEMRLNGHRVGEDLFRPGWSDYRKRVYYQTYDVTRLLRPGRNALGAILGDGWACGYVGLGGRNRYGIGRPRLLAQLNLTFAGGTTAAVATDGAWKSTDGPLLEADLLMGETYDARRELTGWDTPEFRDTAWQPVTVHPVWPARIQAYPCVPVRRILELKPRTVREPVPGAYVFDLGQNMVGWARLTAEGPAGASIRLRFAEMLNPDGTLYTANLRGARCTDTYTLRGGGRETWEPRFTFHGFRYVEVTGYPGRPPRDAITGVVVSSAMPKTGTFACSSPLVNRLQQNIEWGQRGNFLEVPTDCPQRDERLGWMGDVQFFARTAVANMDAAAFLTKWLADVADAQRADGAFPDVAPDVFGRAGTPAWGDAGVIVPWTLYQVYGDEQLLRQHYRSMTRWVHFLEQNSQELLLPPGGYGDWVAAGGRTPTDVLATAYFAYSTSLVAKMARAIGRPQDASHYEALFAKIRDAFNRAYVAPDGRIKGDSQTCYALALHMDLLPPEKRAAAARYLVDDIRRRDWHLSTGFVGTGYLLPVLSRYGHTDVAYRLLLADTYPSWGYEITHGATTIWERRDGWSPERGFQNPGMNSFNHYPFGAVGQWLFSTVAGIDTDPQQPGFRHILIHPQPPSLEASGQEGKLARLTWARATYDSIRGRIATHWKRERGRLTLDVTLPANTTATIHVPASALTAVTESGRPVGRGLGQGSSRRPSPLLVAKARKGESTKRPEREGSISRTAPGWTIRSSSRFRPFALSSKKRGHASHPAPALRFLRMADGCAIFVAGSGDYHFVVTEPPAGSNATARSTTNAAIPRWSGRSPVVPSRRDGAKIAPHFSVGNRKHTQSQSRRDG
jgi:alpha-L-rhamnosidase